MVKLFMYELGKVVYFKNELFGDEVVLVVVVRLFFFLNFWSSIWFIELFINLEICF